MARDVADGRVVISSEPSVRPEDVATRAFATSFRGYDPADVRRWLERVGDELASARSRERELQRTVEELRHQLAHPRIDEETLTTVLGEETSRILRSAREAAADMLGKAEDKVARLVREAEEHAGGIRTQAEGVLAERVEEAEAAAAAIRDAAAADAQALRAAAHGEAETTLEGARQHGREMVAEAQAIRERLLSDLARRRRVGHLQVEQLRAGRDRLLEAYRVVRRTLDEATAELSVAEAEARLAADAAARRVAAEAELTAAELDAALAAARGVDLSPGPVTTTSALAPPAAAAALPAMPAAAPPPAPLTETAVPAPEAAEPPEVAAIETVAAPLTEPMSPPSGEAAAEPAAAKKEGRRASSLRILWSPRQHEPEPEPEPETRSAEPDAAPNPPGATVDDLFARIKADREAAVSRAEQVLASAARDAGDTDAPAPPGGDEQAAAGGDRAALRRRDELLRPLEEALARKLKRALQDEQNEVLERLRTSRGPLTAGVLVGTAAEQAQRYVEAAEESLGRAVEAGSGGASTEDASLAVETAHALADELTEGLRSRVERAVLEAPEPGEPDEPVGLADESVVDRLGAGYREWKTTRVEALARHHLVAAFALGAYRARPEGSTARWVADDEGGACPDCDDNALAGPTPLAQPFPTGQLHPPAHVGCRCLLIEG